MAPSTPPGARVKWAAALAAALLAAATPAADQTHLLVITGISGEARYAEAFHEWATMLIDAARERWGVPSSNIVYLAEDVERAPSLIKARSTSENVERELSELAQRSAPGDQVIIVLIGHGNTRGDESKFNLPGPDMTAQEFDRLLKGLAERKVAFVNASSASGDFIAKLSGANRVIITATRSGRERNETVFPRFFVEAFTGEDADVNQDGQTSLLEAFEYARREVARSYERDGRLLTEHALLDDNGDGEGSGEPDADAADGALAGTMYMAASAASRTPATADPELARLYEEREELEAHVARLRARKGEMEEEAYERQLEDLLVELALKARKIRELEEKGG